MTLNSSLCKTSHRVQDQVYHVICSTVREMLNTYNIIKKILTGHISVSWKNTRGQCVRNGWITNVFPIEVGCRGFMANSTSVFLTNLGLPPSDKRKYMEKIQDKALTASAWIWKLHRATTIWQSLECREILLGRSGLVVMMLRPRNHAWTQGHHLMKALLEAMPLYKHQLLYDTLDDKLLY